MPHHIVSGVANGNITPLSIVKFDTSSTPPRFVLAGNGDRAFGISPNYSRRVPGSSLGMDDGFCAIAGEEFKIYGPGSTDVPVVAGGTITAGQRVGSDGSGFAVAITANLGQYIGIAKVGGVAGDTIILANVQPGEVSV